MEKINENINKITSLINRIEKKELINEIGLISKLVGKASSKLASYVEKSFMKTAGKEVFEAALKTQGVTSAEQIAKIMGRYTSRASGKVVNPKAVNGLLQKAVESPQAFKQDIDKFMRLVPREVVDETTGQIIKFREPYKKYLTEIADDAIKKSNLKAPSMEKITPRDPSRPNSGRVYTGSN